MFPFYVRNFILYSHVPLTLEYTTWNWSRLRSTDTSILIMQLILCLYPGNLKKNLIDSSKRANLTWSELKQEADIIVSTLKEAGQSLYDPLPSGKNVPQFQPAVSPLSPPLK